MATAPASFVSDTPASFQADAAPQTQQAAPAAPPDLLTQTDKPAVTGFGPTATALAKGAYHFIKDFMDVRVPVAQGPESLWNKYVWEPAMAEQKKAETLSGEKGELAGFKGLAKKPSMQNLSAAGHELASFIPFFGPLAAQSGEQLGQAHSISDVAGGTLSGLAAIQGARASLKSEEIAGKVSSTVAALPDAIPQKALMQSAHAALEKSSESAKTDLAVAKANVGTRVGQLVDSISDADLEESSSKGRVGSVKLSAAQDALTDAIDKYGATFGKNPQIAAAFEVMNAAPPRMAWELAKDLRSELGQQMYRAAEGSKQRAVIGAAYAKLTDALEARANELGKGEEFSAYNKLHSTMMDYLHDGILGKLMNKDSGLAFFDEIKKPSNGPQLEALNKDLGKFGLADNFFKSLLDSHKATHYLAKASESGSGGFRGKFAALGAHPVAAGSTFIATSGIPFALPGKFILSLFAAAKAANIADRVQAAIEMRARGGTPQIEGKFGPAANVQP